MIEGTEIQSVSLRDLQPSQLFISQEKLSVVQAHFDFSDPQNVEPIPYKVLDGQKVITDGHTRAFAAHLAGLEALPAYDDPDELDWEAYRICVAWCHEAGIFSIGDLDGRVINHEDYEQLWHDRCRVMQAELAKQRGNPDQP